MLFQLGPVQFAVIPIGLTGVEREVGADFAAKDLIGTRRSREFSGPADEQVTLEGAIFPHRFGGIAEFETLQLLSERGQPQMLIRGDGQVFGWYVIEKIKEKAAYLNAQGVGRKIEFTITLQAVPAGGSPDSIMSMIMNLLD